MLSHHNLSVLTWNPVSNDHTPFQLPYKFPINRISLTWNCNQITIFFLLVIIKRNQFSNIISVPQIQQAFTWHVNPKFCSISGYCLSIFLEKYKCTFRFFLPCLKELLVLSSFNRSHFLLNKRILKANAAGCSIHSPADHRSAVSVQQQLPYCFSRFPRYSCSSCSKGALQKLSLKR